MSKSTRKKNALLLGGILRAFLNGEENGRDRASQLVEKLYDLAMYSDNDNVKLAACRLILERIDGKVVEKKEIKNVKIAGIVHIPRLEDVPVIPALDTATAPYVPQNMFLPS